MKEDIQLQKNHYYLLYKFYQTYTSAKIVFSTFYFTILSYLVFFGRRRHHLSIRNINIVPFKNILNNVANMSPFNCFSNLAGNVLLFIPFSAILILLFKVYKVSTIVLMGFLLSLTIELMQYIFVVGVADIDDVILNTFGSFIGGSVYWIFRKVTIDPRFLIGREQLIS